MNNLQAYNHTEDDRELQLMDKVKKSSQLNEMLLNLFYTISHNLNAYTGNIKMLVDIIDVEEGDPIENRMHLNYLRTVAGDLSKTITDLSQLVYVQNNQNVSSEPLNLNEYIKKVKNIIDGYSVDDKLRIVNNVPEDTFVVHNPAYLESILLNFSTNAIKYAHPDRFPVVEFSLTVENEYKVLSIKDNGQGIDLERYGESLFGLNKTFHQHEDANGYGLYIAKYQIEALKGKVTVASRVGEGTTFKIYFNA